MNYTQLLLTSLLVSSVHPIYAVPPDNLSPLHHELINTINRCDAANFKDKFTALTTQLQSPQEKAVALDLLLACAQAKQAEKNAELERVTGKRIQHRPSLYKATAQLSAALFFGFASIIAIGTGFFDREFVGHETMTSRCALLMVVPMAVWFAYLAKYSVHRALHYSDIIKQELLALDEIIILIGQTRTRSYASVETHSYLHP